MRKIRVAVIMGGLSAEHSVSFQSGSGIVNNLDPKKYRIYPVYIDRDNTWYWSHKYVASYQQRCFTRNYFFGNEFLMHSKKAPSMSDLPEFDLVFNALHGRFGEDGQIQALLEYWGMPHTGSKMAGCAFAMDKIRSKDIYASNGIPTAPWKVLRRNEDFNQILLDAVEEWGFPLPIKDPLGGSSLGMGIAKDMDEALKLVEELFADTGELIVEKFIPGREASCGFIEGEAVLPPTEIISETEYFDFEAKYEGKSKEVTPAEMPEPWIAEMQRLAREAHIALGLSQYSRTDFRIDAEGNLFALETNTLPGFTAASLLPQQAEHNGISYSQLLDILIEKTVKDFSINLDDGLSV